MPTRQYIGGFREVLTVDVATSIATTITLPTGTGAKLAALTLSADNVLPFVLSNGTTKEIVWGTARATDVLTVLRAQEGTTASPFPIGSVITAAATAQGMRNLADLTNPMFLTAMTTDMAGVAGKLGVQARTKAGATRLEFKTPNGLAFSVQPSLAFNRQVRWEPGSGTAMTFDGLTGTISATASHPAPAITTLAESIYRTRFACSTTAGNSAGVRDAVNTIWGGNAAGRGGFYHVVTFMSGNISLSGGQQATCLTSQTTTLAGEPSALPDVIGMIKDTADTNWQFARRTGTGTVQKVSLGVAPANNETFEMTLYRAPNSTTLFVYIIRWNYDDTFTVLLDTSYTTDIPAAATLLGFMCHTRNGVTAAANNIELMKRYTFSRK